MRINSKSYTIDIRPGWKPGTKIKYDEDGVVFEVTQTEHAAFTRVDNDLHCTVFPTSPFGLFSGFTQEVRSLDGRSIRVSFGPFVFKAIVPDEGMPRRGASGKGDMVVHLFANWIDVYKQAIGYARVLMYVVGLWLFLNNPTLAIMAFFGYQAMVNQR